MLPVSRGEEGGPVENAAGGEVGRRTFPKAAGCLIPLVLVLLEEMAVCATGARTGG